MVGGRLCSRSNSGRWCSRSNSRRLISGVVSGRLSSGPTHTHPMNTSKYFQTSKSRKSGWISMDRHKRGDSTTYNTCFKFKSSTKDLKNTSGNDEGLVYYKSYLNTNPKWTFRICISRVSSLEAFSCYPTCGSFAALSSRATAFTGYTSQRFLSYWVAILSRYIRYSRIKLTCLATV